MTTLAEYEAELRAAIDGRNTARTHYLTHEDPNDLSIIEEWNAEIRTTAMALAIARHVAADQCTAADLDRIDHLLDSTVESREARDDYRRDSSFYDPPPEHNGTAQDWDDTDDPLLPYHLVNWTTAWTEGDDDADWLIDPLIAAHRGHAVYAKHGEGKSWTVLAATAALATGRPFLNTPAGKPRHVLYCDYEMLLDDLLERMTGFHYGPTDDLSHLHYALIPSLPPLNTEKGGDALLDLSQTLGAALVVIDTTGRAVQGDENLSDTINEFYRCTGKRLKAEGIALVRVDHAGKSLDLGQRGSSAKGDDVDIVWQVERTEEGQKWTATKRRTSWVPQKLDITVTEANDGTFTFKSADGASFPAGTKDLVDLLDRLKVPVDASRRAVLRDHGSEIHVRTEVLSAALRFRRDRFI